jgi:hypothetical protein
LSRFQYRIVNNQLITSHLGMFDVIELSTDTCIVIYSTDIEPAVLALAIGAAAGEGLHHLEQRFGMAHLDTVNT